MNAIGFKQALGGKPWNVKPCCLFLLLGGQLKSQLLATGLGRRVVMSLNGNQKSPAWLVEPSFTGGWVPRILVQRVIPSWLANLMSDMADARNRNKSVGREGAVTVSFPRYLLSQRKRDILAFLKCKRNPWDQIHCTNLIHLNTKSIGVIQRQLETLALAARSFCAPCYFEFKIPSRVSNLPVKAY